MNILLNNDYEVIRGFVEEILPNFDSSGTVLYEGRNVLKLMETEMGQVVVKSFRKPFLVNSVIYTFFRSSKARRSYDHALVLLNKGIHTPVPVGVVEKYCCGLLSRSFYLSGFDASTQSMRSYLDGSDDDREVLRALAAFIAQIHEMGVLHLDLSPGNILLSRTPSGPGFSVVDLNRMKFPGKLSKEEVYKNFRALACSRKASTYLAEQYALCRGWDVPEAVASINQWSDSYFSDRIFRISRRFMQRDRGVMCSLFGPVQGYYLFRLLRIVAANLWVTRSVSDALFQTEKTRYYRYIYSGDLRRVFEERYGYNK